jgi:hypothetical protein
MPELLLRRRAWLVVAGWAVSLIGFASFGHFVWQSVLRDGGAAYDLHAYVLAGRNLIEGAPLYGPMEINDPGAYRYPPIFAALAVPLALPPEEFVTWLYRAACLGCVRYLVGSWRAAGWALLVVPLQVELVALNVTLPIAAVARMALRGPMAATGVALIPLTAVLKFGTALLLPYLWVTRPDMRRPLLLGTGVTAALVAAHATLDPVVWRSYFASLGQQAASANDAPWVGDQLLFLVPSTLGDFALRFGIGAALVVVAIRYRADWLAFAAAAIAVPTLWAARLGALVAVPRLWLDRVPAQKSALARVSPDERRAQSHAGEEVDQRTDRPIGADVELDPVLNPGPTTPRGAEGV